MIEKMMVNEPMDWTEIRREMEGPEHVRLAVAPRNACRRAVNPEREYRGNVGKPLEDGGVVMPGDEELKKRLRYGKED